MTSFDEKVSELENEIQALDKSLFTCNNSKHSQLFFYGGLIAPCIYGFLLYMLNFKFTRTNNESDRKKILKWAIVLSLFTWVILYFTNIYMKNKT